MDPAVPRGPGGAGLPEGRWVLLSETRRWDPTATLAVGRCIARADRTAFARICASRTARGIAVARTVSALAELGVVYPVVAFTSVVALPQSGWRRGCLPILTVASGAVVRRAASRAVARPRLPAAAWLITPEGCSLPSKHTTVAALGTGACLRALGVRWSLARAAALMAACGIGASRVYLGVHWPSDVAAGWLFADGWLRLTDLMA